MKKNTHLLIIIAVALLSCNGLKNTNQNENTDQNKIVQTNPVEQKVDQKEAVTQTKGLPLASNWIIEFFNEENAKPVSTKNSNITIQQDLHSFSGNGGCNSLGGKLEVNGYTIRFSEIVSTKMACDHLDQEQVFVNSLMKVKKYKIVGGELFLYKDDLLIMTLESFR